MHWLCTLCRDLHCTRSRRSQGKTSRRVEERQGVRLLSRKVHFRRRLSRCLPNTCYLLDEANGVHLRTTSPSAQEWCVRQGLGRRLSLKRPQYISPLFTFLFSNHPKPQVGFYLSIRHYENYLTNIM